VTGRILLAVMLVIVIMSGCTKKYEEKIEVLTKEKETALRENAELKKKIQESEAGLSKIKSELLDANLTSEIERQTADAIYKELTETLKTEIESGMITVKRLYKALVIHVQENVFFKSGAAYLKPEGKKALAKIGPILKKVLKGKIIQVQGHTDNQPIGPNLIKFYPSNWELGAFRALQVVHFLAKNVPIEEKYLSAASFSAYRPLEKNDTVQGRAKNRRIDIMLLDERIYQMQDMGKDSGKEEETEE